MHDSNSHPMPFGSYTEYTDYAGGAGSAPADGKFDSVGRYVEFTDDAAGIEQPQPGRAAIPTESELRGLIAAQKREIEKLRMQNESLRATNARITAHLEYHEGGKDFEC